MMNQSQFLFELSMKHQNTIKSLREQLIIQENYIKKLKEDKLELQSEIEFKERIIESFNELFGKFRDQIKTLKIKITCLGNDKTLLNENIRVLRVLNAMGTRRQKFQKRPF